MSQNARNKQEKAVSAINKRSERKKVKPNSYDFASKTTSNSGNYLFRGFIPWSTSKNLKFKILQESCMMDSILARILQANMEELCNPLQDFLQDRCKLLNLSITRKNTQVQVLKSRTSDVPVILKYIHSLKLTSFNFILQNL